MSPHFRTNLRPEALKVAEIENLNHALAEKNNKATVAEVPPAISPADQATEVMKQLFNKKKED